jgi:hypothetical protein
VLEESAPQREGGSGGGHLRSAQCGDAPLTAAEKAHNNDMAAFDVTPLGTTTVEGIVPWNRAGELLEKATIVAELKDFLLDGGRAAWYVYGAGGRTISIADTPAQVEEAISINITRNRWYFHETYSNSTS